MLKKLDEIGDSLSRRFHRDPILKGANPEAIRLFVVKILNLLKEGHTVSNISFYWTPGIRYKRGSSPNLRAMMAIDGKSNRFWFEPGWMGHNTRWHNTTKANQRKKRG